MTRQCLANLMALLFVLWLKMNVNVQWPFLTTDLSSALDPFGNVPEILTSPKQRAQLSALFGNQKSEVCCRTFLLILLCKTKTLSLVMQLLYGLQRCARKLSMNEWFLLSLSQRLRLQNCCTYRRPLLDRVT